MKSSFLSSELQRKIRQVTLQTNRLLGGLLVGDSRTAQKGVGFEFHAIRDYQIGDDVRFIHWQASSRMSTVLVKEYVEERNRIILLVVDVSKSSIYGTQAYSKREVSAQISSMFALIAAHCNDQVGLLLFSDRIEKYIPPRRGKLHVNAIMETVFNFTPQGTRTESAVVFKELLKLKKKNALVFFISDCIDDAIDRYLSHVARLYDFIVIRLLDKYERSLPSVGFVTVEDIETGDTVFLDMQSSTQSLLQKRLLLQDRLFKKTGVEMIDVMDWENFNFIHDVIRFFRKRRRF